MQRKKITKVAMDSLIIILMVSFVISAIFPDYSEEQTVKIEETDFDGEESSEEKKESEENEEQKKNFQQNFEHASSLLFENQNRSDYLANALVLQELYLPVTTPPPDQLTSDS